MADGAKRGLWEKRGRELMALDVVDFGLFDGSSALMQSKEAFVLEFTHVLCVCRKRTGDRVTFCHMAVRAGGSRVGEMGKGQRLMRNETSIETSKSQVLLFFLNF